MSTLPATGVMGDLDPGHTNAQFAAEIEAFRDFVSNRPGGGARAELTIAAGAVVPGVRDHGGFFTIDTQGDAATDDLDVVTYTNMPNGSVIRVYAENAARVVTLKHGNGGAGEMLMTDGADFVFAAVDQWVEFQRRSTSWVEVDRNYGIAGTPRSVQVFTADGTYSKPAWLRYAIVEGVGGGGGGGGAEGGAGAAISSGGGAGGPFRFHATAAQIGSTESVTIGAGGAGGAAGNNNGVSGGTTTFGTLATATGGSNGIGSSNGTGSAAINGGDGGGTTYSGVTALLRAVVRLGGMGDSGLRVSGLLANLGHGGDSLFGAGGRATGGNTGSNAGAAGAGYGAGGAGGRAASVSDVVGGDGANGVVIVWEYS